MLRARSGHSKLCMQYQHLGGGCRRMQGAAKWPDCGETLPQTDKQTVCPCCSFSSLTAEASTREDSIWVSRVMQPVSLTLLLDIPMVLFPVPVSLCSAGDLCRQPEVGSCFEVDFWLLVDLRHLMSTYCLQSVVLEPGTRWPKEKQYMAPLKEGKKGLWGG